MENKTISKKKVIACYIGILGIAVLGGVIGYEIGHMDKKAFDIVVEACKETKEIGTFFTNGVQVYIVPEGLSKTI